MDPAIEILSKQPNWKEWKKFGSIKLKQALILSMNICPNWYEDCVEDGIRNLLDNSEYHRPGTDEEMSYLEEIHSAVEEELMLRKKITCSWFAKQDWIIGAQPSSPDAVTLDTLIDLQKFMPFAFNDMGFVNIGNSVLEEFQKSDSIKEVLIDDLQVASKKIQSDWKLLAKKIGENYLDDYGISGGGADRTQTEVAQYIKNRFQEDGVKSKKGGILSFKTIIRECIHGEWWQSMIQKGKVLSK